MLIHSRPHDQRSQRNSPLDLEARHPRLLVDIAHKTLETNGLRQRLLHLLVVVLRVLIIPDAHELLLLVRPGEDERGDAQRVLGWDLGRVGRGALELERVDAGGDGPDEAVVELLVELLVARGGDVDEAPFEIWRTGISTDI